MGYEMKSPDTKISYITFSGSLPQDAEIQARDQGPGQRHVPLNECVQSFLSTG